MSVSASPTCEFIMKWYGGKDNGPIFCGTLATRRYPAMGGGFMHMCDEHSIPLINYTEPVPAGGDQK